VKTTLPPEKIGLSLDDARLVTLHRLAPSVSITVALEEAVGHVLAESVFAERDDPRFNNSAMDGWAIHIDDGYAGNIIKATGSVFAGSDVAEITVEPGRTVRVMTGAEMPKGASLVAPVEIVEEIYDAGEVSSIRLIEAAADHIRRRGENYRRGDVLLRAGSVLVPSCLSLAASAGSSTLCVKRPFKVAILPSGDELVKPGGVLGPGQLHESNSLALAGMVKRLGHHAIVLPIVGDDIDETRSALDIAAGADVILTSGGISMGEADHIRALMESEGEVDFWRISMKPGGPPLFGAWRGKPIFGLPGNSVSTQVVFILLVAPWLAASQGAGIDDPNLTARRVPVIVEESFRANRKKQTFPRVIISYKNNNLIAISPSHQGSGNTLNMALANGILDIPAGAEIPAGSTISALLFD